MILKCQKLLNTFPTKPHQTHYPNQRFTSNIIGLSTEHRFEVKSKANITYAVVMNSKKKDQKRIKKIIIGERPLVNIIDRNLPMSGD